MKIYSTFILDPESIKEVIISIIYLTKGPIDFKFFNMDGPWAIYVAGDNLNNISSLDGLHLIYDESDPDQFGEYIDFFNNIVE